MIITKRSSTILVTLSLGIFCVNGQPAPHNKGMGSEHMMAMGNEPHHMLAMAYHKNVATFAKTLEQQAKGGTVNVAFARAAAAEMRRSFDQMQVHHADHMKTMPADMQAKMQSMMQQMETHRTEMKTSLQSLETEVGLATPDAKKVSALALSVSTHCEAMMNQSGMSKH